MKGGLRQPFGRKQLIGGHPVINQTRGLLQWVQSINFVSISIDQSLHLIFQADSTSPGGTQGSSNGNVSGYHERFTPVNSLGTIYASYILIASPSMYFLPRLRCSFPHASLPIPHHLLISYTAKALQFPFPQDLWYPKLYLP
ncbi:hypothetical protein ACSBR2_025786 [Camellia fascicularis]